MCLVCVCVCDSAVKIHAGGLERDNRGFLKIFTGIKIDVMPSWVIKLRFDINVFGLEILERSWDF